MRKTGLLLFSVSVICSSISSQDVIPRITKNYFRSDPFRGEFGDFMKHLVNDPSLTSKTIEKRTDSTLFYFDGLYNTTVYNPFFFKPTRLEVVLAEVPVELDSLVKDTIFVYELFAFNTDTKQGSEEVKKEFNRIFKHYKGSFYRNEYTEIPTEKRKGEIYNFFDRYHAVAPFALTLYGPGEKKETCLVVTIRLDNFNNMAVLAAPFMPYKLPEEEEEVDQ